MIRSLVIGLVAGQRGPLAVVATATRRSEIDADLPLDGLLKHPVIAAGTAALAAAEMAGDKMKSAPALSLYPPARCGTTMDAAPH